MNNQDDKKGASTWTIVFGVLFGVSEALAQIPALQSNSVIQLLVNVFRTLSGQ